MPPMNEHRTRQGVREMLQAADSSRPDRSLTVMRDSYRSPSSARSETPVICASSNSAVAANCRRVLLVGRLVKVILLTDRDQVLLAR